MDKTIQTLTEVLQMSKEGTKPYDTTAEVVRIEGQTACVHIPGGIDETPVSMTIDARVGDIVQVRVSGGRAWITGNASAPPTDDKVANAARQTAQVAEAAAAEATELSETAKKQAAAAAKIAADTEQHFWFTETGADTGAHITEKTQEDFLDDPDNGGGNLLARSNGIALRDGLIELATLQQSGLDVNTYAGGGNQINIAHLGYGLAETQGGSMGDAPYYDLGIRQPGSTIGAYSLIEGEGCVASKYTAHAEGAGCRALEQQAHAEGVTTTAADIGAHAEGWSSEANGMASHAEGLGCIAEGVESHAQNSYTIAGSDYQTALGKYNIADSADTYVVIVGNGTADNARSNALTVDWSGNVEASGDITDGNGNVLSAMLNASLLGDYVVSRGTSGNWKYIKWNSGRVECEGYYTFSSLTFSASGNSYRSSVTAFSIPSGIFTTAPDEGNAWINASGASAYFGAVIGSFSTTGGNCQVWKSTSGNATNVTVHMKLVYRG